MPDAQNVETISKHHEVDPVFAEVVGLLFGDAVDIREAYDISKLNDASEGHINGGLKLKKKPSDRTQRKITAALSATGAAAGVAGLAYGANDMREAYKAGRRIKGTTKALVPLEVAGLAGEVMATKILHGDTKKHVKKALDDIIDARRAGQIDSKTAIELASSLVEKSHRMSRAQLVTRAEMAEQAAKDAPHAGRVALGTGVVVGAGTGYALGRKAGQKYAERKLKPVTGVLPKAGPAPAGKHRSKDDILKADLVDYVYSGEISKRDDEKQLVFGWCSLSTVDGQPVVDLQGDYAPIEEVEKSAYAYVISSRVGGDMHARDGAKALHTSDLVESFIATPEKLEQMGVPGDVAKGVPTGWWVGYKVNDDEQWAMVKDGRRAGFSIHGKGSRVQKALT